MMRDWSREQVSSRYKTKWITGFELDAGLMERVGYKNDS